MVYLQWINTGKKTSIAKGTRDKIAQSWLSAGRKKGS